MLQAQSTVPKIAKPATSDVVVMAVFALGVFNTRLR